MYDNHIHIYYGPADPPETFLQKTREAGISGGSIISLYPETHGAAPQGCEQSWEYRLDNVLEFTSQTPGFYPLFWIDPLAKDVEKQIETAAQKGIKGFKIICSYFYPRETLPALRIMAAHQLPVLFHSGILYSTRCASKYNRPLEFEELLAVKGLRFALAHVGWPWTDEFNAIVGEARNGFFHSDIYVDITPGTPGVYREEVLKRLYFSGFEDLANRVLWGSDGSTNNYNIAGVKFNLDMDKKIFDKFASPGYFDDIPVYSTPDCSGLWEKLDHSNREAFFKRAVP